MLDWASFLPVNRAATREPDRGRSRQMGYGHMSEQPLDDFIRSELDRLGPKAMTVDRIRAEISHTRIYDALERLCEAGSAEPARPIGKEKTYKPKFLAFRKR